MKSFLVRWNEISGNRWDPLYHSGSVKGFFEKLNYKKVPLKQLIYFMQSGIGAGKQEQSNKDEGFLQIRPTNIDNFGMLKLDRNIYVPKNKKYPLIQQFDVLFNNTNSQELVGKTLYVDKQIEASYSNHITRIVVNKDYIEPEFLWIIFNFYQEQKIFYNICTNWNNQSGIGIDILERLPIPLPLKNIQTDIINKMKKAYKKKQEAEQKAEKLLESIDDYILKELNIELPKIEEKNIKDRVFIRKWSEISRNRWDSEYYKKPYREFEKILNKLKNITTIGSITNFIASGSTPKSKGSAYVEKSDYYFLRLVNFNDNLEIDFTNALYVKEEIYNKSLKRVQLKYGDILFGIAGSIGKIAIYKHNKKAVINQAIAILRFKKDVNSEYIAFVLNSIIVKNQIQRLQRPVAQPNLNTEELKSIKIPLPDKDTQDTIVKKINTIREEAKKLKKQALEDFKNTKKEIEKMLLKDKK